MVDLPDDVLAAMYPVISSDETSDKDHGSSGSSSGGIAFIGKATRLLEAQQRLCAASGLNPLSAPTLPERFTAQIRELASWVSRSSPSVILFDDATLAAGLAQVLQRPLLRAASYAFDPELMRVRVSAPLWKNLLVEDAAGRDLPQIILLL